MNHDKKYNLQKVLSFRRCFVDSEWKVDSVEPNVYLAFTHKSALFCSGADNSKLQNVPIHPENPPGYCFCVHTKKTKNSILHPPAAMTRGTRWNHRRRALQSYSAFEWNPVSGLIFIRNWWDITHVTQPYILGKDRGRIRKYNIAKKRKFHKCQCQLTQ